MHETYALLLRHLPIHKLVTWYDSVSSHLMTMIRLVCESYKSS